MIVHTSLSTVKSSHVVVMLERTFEVDEKFNETGTIVSDGLRRRRSDHASRNIDAINMTMQSAAKVRFI